MTTTVSISSPLQYLPTDQSTSTTTGALVIAGGVGIAKNLNVGGDLIITGNVTNQNITKLVTNVSLIQGQIGLIENTVNDLSSVIGSVQTAKDSATAAYNAANNSINNALTSANHAFDSLTSMNTAVQAKIDAVAAQGAAAGSAAAAATSASNAATSSTNAGNSATAASNSASSASTAATNAGNSASTASTHATNAANSASASGNSASAASTSASQALTYANNAAGSAAAAVQNFNQLSAKVDLVQSQMGTASADLTDKLLVMVDANSQTALRLQNLESNFSNNVGTTNATITNLATTVTTGDTANATAITNLTTTVTNNYSTLNSSISSLATTVSTGDATNATAISNLTSTVNTNNTTVNAVITTEQNTRAAADTTLATKIDLMQAAFGDVAASISDVNSTIATATTALASRTTIVESKLNGQSASISTLQSSVNGNDLTYAVTLNNNGSMSGFALTSAARTNGGTPTSAFVVAADKFAIVDPNVAYTAGNTPSGAQVPFVVRTTTDPVTGTGPGTYINSAYLQYLYVNQLINGGLIGQSTKYRQTVLSGPQDSVTSYPNFLTLSGNNVSLQNVSSTYPLGMSFANGFGSNADLNCVINSNSNNILTVDTTYQGSQFIYADYVDPFHVTWGTTKNPPQYGRSFSSPSQSILNFEAGSTTATGLLKDEYGNTWGFGTTVSSTTGGKFGSQCLVLPSTNQGYISCADIDNVGNGPWSISAWVSWPTVQTAGTDDIFYFANAGGYGAIVTVTYAAGGVATFHGYLSNSGTSHDIANNTSAPSLTITANTWYQVVLNYDGYMYSMGVGTTGTLTTVTLAASTLKICPIAKANLGYRGSGTNYPMYKVDEFRFLRKSMWINTGIIAQTAQETVEGDYFDIDSMTMYSITGAAPFTTKSVTVSDIVNDIFSSGTAHGFRGGECIVFHGTAPTGATVGLPYYVLGNAWLYDTVNLNYSNSSVFQLATTPAGTPINITAASGSYTISVSSTPTFTKINRLYVAEFLNPTNAPSMDHYSYRGEYMSEWFPVAINTQYNFKHYIGTGLVNFDVYFNTYKSDDQSYKITGAHYVGTTNNIGGALVASTGRTTYSLKTSPNYLDTEATILSNTDYGRQTYGYYKVHAKRAW